MMINQVDVAKIAILVSGIFVGCAKVDVDHRPLKGVSSTANISNNTNMVIGKELAFSGFPDWCNAKPQADGTTCIVCERKTDSQETVKLSNLCFEPRTDFDPKLHCGLSQVDLGIKNLLCHSMDKDVSTDASLLVDRAATILSTTLFSIKNALQDKYKDDAAALAIAMDVAQFASDHVPSVLSNKDMQQTASDLLLLANKYLVTPYPDGTDKEAIKVQLLAKLNLLHTEFSGTTTFSATKLFSVALNIAKVFPPERLGKAADILTGAGLGTLLETRKSELEPAIAGWSANTVGFTSVDELIQQVKGP